MSPQSVYLINELSVNGRSVTCRYAVAFLAARHGHNAWYAVVYDPAPEALCVHGAPASFQARTTSGARLRGQVIPGEPDPDVGVHYLEGVGTLHVREPFLSRAEVRAEARAAEPTHDEQPAYTGGRLYTPLRETEPVCEPVEGDTTVLKAAGWLRASRWARLGSLTAAVFVLGFAAWGIVSAVIATWNKIESQTPATLSPTSRPLIAGPVLLTSVVIDGQNLDRGPTLAILRQDHAGAGWSVELLAVRPRLLSRLPKTVVLGAQTSSDQMLVGVAEVRNENDGNLRLKGLEPLHLVGGLDSRP